MIYKRLGRTDLKISRLGFGAMRLPQLEDGKPDPDESVRIIHRAFELGVNYIDTAVMYCQHQSESIMGQALKGWRERVYVSTKNHYRGANEKAWWKNLEKSLERLDVDYIDVYNLHGINWEIWERWVKGPDQILSWMRKAYDQGLIRHMCCSFHDDAEALEKIVDTDAFSSITLQYNILDRSLEAVFPKIAEKDLGIVVMGPVGGGRLGGESGSLTNMIEGARSVPEVALRFVLANPNVTAAISGMSSVAQVEENCAVAARPEPLSDAERRHVMETLERFQGLADLYCTGCNYCVPCPQGVDIPGVFLAVNMDRVYGLADHARARYKSLVGKATYCTACGRCESKCPQNISIGVQLREAAARFDPAYGQMALALEPVDLREDSMQLRARIHNLTDSPNKATVRLAADGGLHIDPNQFEVRIEEPFKVEEKALALGRLENLPRMIRINADIEDAGGRRERTVSSRFMIGECRRVESMDALRASADQTAPLAIEHEEQVYAGKGQLNRPYMLKAWTGYTPEALLVYDLIQDGGAAPAGLKSHVAMLFDLRSCHGNLPPGFHDGMFMLRVAPGADGTPEVQVLRGELEAGRVSVDASAIPGGFELRIQMPWEALGGYSPNAGQAFGFESVLAVPDEQGEPVFRAGWSANPNVQRDAIKLGTLFFTQ